jgi:hypothetical protein
MLHPTSNGRHPTSNIQLPTSNFQLPTSNIYNIQHVTGPRTLASAPNNRGSAAAAPTTQFLFDLMYTPAHALDLKAHWKSRYLQIGYGGVGYSSPAHVVRPAQLLIVL